VMNPIQKYHDDNMGIIQDELTYMGVSVIIPRRECLQTIASRIRSEKYIVKTATE